MSAISAVRRHPVRGDLPVLDDQRDPGGVAQHGNIGERVAVDDDEIGELAGADRAEPVLPAQAFGGPSGRGLQGLHRRHPGFDEAFEFAGIFRVTVAAGIGAGHDPDAEIERPPYRR